MKTATDAIQFLIDLLNELGVDYMLVGSLSSNFYGVARATRDADFVVSIRSEQWSTLLARLPSDFRIDPQQSFETFTLTTRRILELPALPFTVELFDLSDDEHDQERFRRRVKVPTMGRTVTLPTAEDVVVQKLRWCSVSHRAKDYSDAVQVLAVQGPILDFNYIRHWCSEHGTSELLAQAICDAALPDDET